MSPAPKPYNRVLFAKIVFPARRPGQLFKVILPTARWLEWPVRKPEL
jgi:hypothetical protein